MAHQPDSSSRRRAGGFTLVELLVVIAVLGILAIVAIPQLLQTREKAVIKEAQTNIMKIAGELERFHADGNFSYTSGDSSAGCPDSDSYTGGNQVGVLPIAIEGSYYSYTVTTTDPNADSLCENYTITATGAQAPATASTAGPLTLNQNGVKTGPWR